VRANQFLLFLFNETINTNCVVLSLSRPGIEPTMPARYHNTMWLERISHNLWVVIAIDIRPLYSMAYIMIKAEYGECVSEGPKGATCLPVDWCFRVITIKIQLSITSQAILQL
jgi:hypothetical protein